MGHRCHDDDERSGVTDPDDGVFLSFDFELLDACFPEIDSCDCLSPKKNPDQTNKYQLILTIIGKMFFSRYHGLKLMLWSIGHICSSICSNDT